MIYWLRGYTKMGGAKRGSVLRSGLGLGLGLVLDLGLG